MAGGHDLSWIKARCRRHRRDRCRHCTAGRRGRCRRFWRRCRRCGAARPTRRFTQFAGRPIADFTQPLRVPKNLADLSDSGGRTARQLGDLAIELTRAGRIWAERLLSWAAERPVSPNSVTGIALLAALCAAAWFSGGSAGDDLRGLLAVAVWALARVCARRLALATAQRESAPAKPGTGKGQGAKRARLAIGAAPGHTDWLVLPAFNWTPDHPEPTADRSGRAAGTGAGHRPPGRRSGQPPGAGQPAAASPPLPAPPPPRVPRCRERGQRARALRAARRHTPELRRTPSGTGADRGCRRQGVRRRRRSRFAGSPGWLPCAPGRPSARSTAGSRPAR